MKTIILLSTIFIMLPLFSGATIPIVYLKKRCSEDPLNVNQSIERNMWALKCKHITQAQYNRSIFEYDENDHKTDRMLARPLYPLFSDTDLTVVFKAPLDRNTPCIDLPKDIHVFAFCVSSCYTPDQKILFPEGEIPIFDAMKMNLKNIITLDEGSFIDDIKLKVTPIQTFVDEIVDTKNNIIQFETSTGKRLKVTPNHPLINDKGEIQEASTIKVGDSLLNTSGIPELVISKKSFVYFGRVYNLFTNSTQLLENIIIAEGLLSGSAYYQNEGVIHLNRNILRKQIPKSIYR